MLNSALSNSLVTNCKASTVLKDPSFIPLNRSFVNSSPNPFSSASLVAVDCSLILKPNSFTVSIPLSLNTPAVPDASNILNKSSASPPAALICVLYSFIESNKSPCTLAFDKKPSSINFVASSPLKPNSFISTFAALKLSFVSAPNVSSNPFNDAVKRSKALPSNPVNCWIVPLKLSNSSSISTTALPKAVAPPIAAPTAAPHGPNLPTTPLIALPTPPKPPPFPPAKSPKTPPTPSEFSVIPFRAFS